MIVVRIVVGGAAAGIVHTVAVAILYGIPWVSRNRGTPSGSDGKQADGGRRGLGMKLLGTLIEIYAMTIGFAWIHPLLPLDGLLGALLLALLFTVLRTFAPIWALWLQAVYSGRYLAIEAIGGTLGSVAVVLTLYAFTL
ncbi:hypothetical protein ACFXPS_38740 [Nocardia sp. NPDC059091]|uniref:hypothetical protein n=1 Tax=unclassified Nocardia TaxID=2637762 RepID=UPI0036A34C40